MPAFNELYETIYRDAGVDVVGIAQFNTTENEAVQFINDNGLAFPNIYDGAADLAQAYSISAVPGYVFLDNHGTEYARWVGAAGTDKIVATLDSLLIR